MRALAMTGIVTAAWISRILSGSAMRATPPSRRMSAGTRSSAITATAPESSAIRACSSVVTSMITPPLSISARPRLTRNVARSAISPQYRGQSLLQLEGPDPVPESRLVARVDAMRERLDDPEQGRVRTRERRAVRRVVEGQLRVLTHLGEGRVRDREGAGAAVAGKLHGADHEWVGAARREGDHQRVLIDPAQP